MMFFYSLLHSLVQYPKDYLAYGISHCRQMAMPEQTTASSPSTFNIKEDTIPSLGRSITNKLKAYYPTISEEYINFVLNNIQAYMDPKFWTSLKNVNVVINILDPVSKSSMLFYIRFENSKSVAPFLFTYQMTSVVSSNVNTIRSSFISLTIYDLIDSKIENVQSKTLPQITITREILTSISIPTNSLLTGILFVDTTFVKQAVQYLSENYPKLLSTLTYIKDSQSDILQIINKYLSKGILDLTEVRNEMIRICMITPTPVPEPQTPPKKNIMKIPEFEEFPEFEVKPHKKRYHHIKRPIRYN